MAEVAYYDTASSAAEKTRPPLELVTNITAQAARAGGARPWRSAAIGATLGFFIATVVITLVGTLAGIGVGGAFGLAVFVGAFGGLGFGFMMGGMTSLAREFGPHSAEAIAYDGEDNR